MRRLLPLLFVLLPLSAQAGPAGDASWPTVSILPAPPGITIDGIVSPGEWEQTTVLTGFTRLGQSEVVARQPLVHMAWTRDALLVAAEIPLPPGQKAKAAATDYDGTVWEDDSVELHLDRGHAHKQNYQFVINALGTHFDALGGDRDWNSTWQAKAVNTPGQWSVEIAIPWQAVGTAPRAGDVDGFNILINSSYLGGTLSLSPLKSSAHETPNYTHLLYTQGLALSLDRLGVDDQHNEIALRGLGAGEATVEYKLLRADREAALDSRTLKLAGGASATIPVKIPSDQGLPQAGLYTVNIVANGPAGLLLSRRVALQVAQPLRVVLNAFVGEQHLDLYLRPHPAVFNFADTDFDITVSGPAGIIKQLKYTRPATAGDQPDLTLPANVLPAGKLVFSIVATNRKTGQTVTVERTLDNNPLRPVWWGTKEGLSDKVPAPWIPVSIKDGLVKCWGRVYDFGRSLLPAKVTTRQASVLVAPIALKGTVERQPLVWKGEQLTATEKQPTHVKLIASAASSALKLHGRAVVEYDGMVRVDLTLTPVKGSATVQDLTLEIPLKTTNARYLYHFPGQWGSVANDGFVPKGGWSHAFKPFVWLGDEDRGFAWWCESDRNWFPQDNKQALTIEPAGPVTYLRCHLIATETKISKPLQYTFGLQATPVKQPEKTVWDYRITHFGNYGLENERAVTGGKITYPAPGHIRREEGTFECWYRPGVDSERDLPVEQRQYMANRQIFTVESKPGMEGSNYGLYWNERTQGLVVWARTNGIVTDNPGTSFDWKAGEWHHVAMTWDQNTLRIYLDGKLLSETPNHGFLAAPLEDATICIGGDGALATIDEARILSVARPPTMLDQPYEPDAETLLLDHFDDYGLKESTPVGVADAWLTFAPGKFGQAATWAPSAARTRLEALADQGVRTICFHEHWVPYQAYPHPVEADKPRLHSLVDGIHANNMSLLLYMARQFADNAPEWELYSDDACSTPRPAPYTREPKQNDYVACWNGPYKDFSLYWLAKTMDEFGHDGWYLDGPEWPMQCTNRHHGCGYIAPDGTVRPTWDIFATREFMQRLYVLTRQRKPQGQLNIHNSTVLVSPTLGWGTSFWSGEQIDSIPPPVKTLDILPMDAFRTEFMGRQWGVPAEFLVYDGRPYYAKDLLAYTLLHGVPIRPSSADALQRLSALWKVHDEFPFSHGEMLGYWNNASVIKVQPEGVYASVWRLPKQGSLVVVSNLTDHDADASVSLNLTELGSGKGRVWDALSNETLRHDRGSLILPVASWRYRVLRVE